MVYCSYTNERGDGMKNKCVLSMINEINNLSNELIKKELQVLNIPVLINHVSLFYILPEDGTTIEFRELREAWGKSKSSLSDILKKYESLGYVYKVPTSDKRCVMIGLTQDAIILKQRFMAIEAKILDKMVIGFSGEDRERLENDIVKVLNNMK